MFVPLNALLQWRSPADRRGAIIAVSNVLAYGGMLLGSILALVLARPASTPAARFCGASIVLGCGFLWALSLVPEAFLRFLLVGLAHTIYRVRVVGRPNVPAEGGALLVPNHVTFADGLFIIASIDRPVRFMVYHELLRPAVHRPVPAVHEGDSDRLQRRPEDDPPGLPRGRQGTRRRRSRLHFSRRPAHANRSDGPLSARASAHREGPHQPDHPGPPRPLEQQRFQPGQPQPATLAPALPDDDLVWPAAPPDASLFEIRQAIRRLDQEAWAHRKEDLRPLHHGSFVRHANTRSAWPWPICKRRTYRSSSLWPEPSPSPARSSRAGQTSKTSASSCPQASAALANLAAALAGKTAVNLNFTTGRLGMESAAKQAGLKTAGHQP